MGKHNELGKKGEQIAAEFLLKKEHIVLATNFRYQHREIDIISSVGKLLVFSEIKTRSSLRYGFPEEAVTPEKQKLIKEAAASYLEQYPMYDNCRFDVISIVISGENIIQIRHFEDAFY